ncbi:MAG TPA: RNA polymerase factor sigma-54 [Bacteroidota bacterium]|nr:RNA polymerase factor sigma-54 [Bacteroidota bacterium]
MLQISQQQRLLQKLTPQQIQYLKLLQLPTIALEQRIKTELEQNPLLEEGVEDEIELNQEDPIVEEPEVDESANGEAELKKDKDEEFSFEDFVNDEQNNAPRASAPQDDEERDEIPISAPEGLTQKLTAQLHLADLTDIGMLIADEIIGNIDEDGYLRRDLSLIVQDINLSHDMHLTVAQAEIVLKRIQRLEPVGIGSRSLQECLLLQLEARDFDPHLKELARVMLEKYFDEFTKKHFEQLSKQLGVSLQEVEEVLDLVSHLNPKPGEGEITTQENYITVDFIVHFEDGEFIIQLNDKNIPPLRINKEYKDMMSRKKKNGVNSETKTFIRQKFEAAKWFIASIYQRRDTMLRVMRTIVDKQRQFFETGEGLKPMIYKDIAEVIHMDISTISRVVNGKYVQTDYGVHELRYFFSEGISTQSGEDVSNKEVKLRIKEILETEDPHKPLSDDRIAEILNERGFNIARRTVAKYRESMMIPVARLRRKISSSQSQPESQPQSQP